MITPSWDDRFMGLADHVAQWSKDPSSKVGAVLVNDFRQVIGMGYNGFPRGTSDDAALYSDRSRKYLRVVHAEVNALFNSATSTHGTTIYVTHPCCSQCMAKVIQAGVKRVVYRDCEGLRERMGESIDEALIMAGEAGIVVCVRGQ